MDLIRSSFSKERKNCYFSTYILYEHHVAKGNHHRLSKILLIYMAYERELLPENIIHERTLYSNTCNLVAR